MSRRKRSPEELERKAKVRELMRELDINDMSDINALFKEFVGDVPENGLEAELDEELGYSGYDYRNKSTDNGRSGHSTKTMKTSFGEIDIDAHIRDIYGIGALSRGKWNGKYPKIAQSWNANQSKLPTYFKYPQEVRTLIYTTNAIEGFNRQLRKVTKSKSVFPPMTIC